MFWIILGSVQPAQDMAIRQDFVSVALELDFPKQDSYS
jgi:hypothetical protein